jgi:hypothetical protein
VQNVLSSNVVKENAGFVEILLIHYFCPVRMDIVSTAKTMNALLVNV